MSAASASPASAARPASGRGDRFVGTGTLVRFLLRRDRVKLPAWTVGLGLFVVYVATAIPSIAGSPEELRGATQLFRDPVGRLFVGPGYGFDDPSFERFLANGYGLYLLVLAALMSNLLVVRHTRAEEQTGRAELVRANVVGRHASLTAALVVALVTNLVGAALVAAAPVGDGGFGVHGSLLLAASVGATGLAFAGIAAICVQLSAYSRAASGMAGAVLGAAFLVRAVGDMAGQGGTALSWLSPLAWGQQTAPFVLDRWWPLGLTAGLAVATTLVAYQLADRRDLGASLVAVRPGRPTARPGLGTPIGSAIRFQRASTIGWGAALAVTGLLYGAYANALLEAVGDMPAAFTELFGAEDMLAGYLAYIATFAAFLAGAYGVMAVQGWRSEETTGRLEPVLATPISRWAWLGSNVAVTTGGVVVIMAGAGLATGVGAAVVTGDGRHVGELLVAHLNHVPAVLVVVAVATLLFGWLPRAVPVAWVLVGFGLVAATFGPLLDLPQAVLDLSPFEHTAELPVEPFALTPFLALAAIAAATTVVGLQGFRRRDLDLR